MSLRSNNVLDITTSVILFKDFNVNLDYFGVLLGTTQFREGLRGIYMFKLLQDVCVGILSGLFLIISGRRALCD